jgi:HK97 family phage major capsid protein
MSAYLDRLVEARARAWEEGKALLDTAAAESRDLTAEETETYERISSDMDERTTMIEKLRKDEDREVRAAEFRIPQTPMQTAVKSDAEVLRELIAGERRVAKFEQRAMSKANDAEIVPQGFYDVLQTVLRYTGPAFQPGLYTILSTASGEQIKVPRQLTFSTGSLTAEAAAFAESNPTGESFNLDAFKYGTLIKISRELLEDSGVDVVGFIAEQAGNALGAIVNSELAIGNGSDKPNGIFVAAGSGVRGTATDFKPSADDLIDLWGSLDSAYASRPSTVFQMRRATLAHVRKLRDGDGQYLFDVSGGATPTILGHPIVENPYAPAMGTAAKSVIFGSMDSYHVRRVRDIEVARSDEAYFENDLVGFRVSVRLDGDLGQPSAVKFFQGK